jgi:hypothetical protein
MSLTTFLAEALLIGHSLIGPTLPGMLETAARTQGLTLRAEAQITNGAPLKWNWDNSADAEGVDARARLPLGKTDVVVLTESIPLASQIEWNQSASYARQFYDLAVQSNPRAQVFMYETWHSLHSGTPDADTQDPGHATPWRARLTQDLPLWEGIVAAVNTNLPEGATPMRLIPAGQAMAALHDAITERKVPGISSIDDVFSDDIHLNDRGLYFVALVMHAAIHGRDPQGLPTRLTRLWSSRTITVTEPMARAMQRIAWDTVRGYAPPALPAPQTALAAPEPAAEPPPLPEVDSDIPTEPPAPPEFAPIAASDIGFGLAGVTDWSVQQPFVDVFKTARPWTGHLPGQFGGWGHDELAAGGWLDEHGWLRAMPPALSAVSALFLTDLPEDATHAAGRYVLRHEGQGRLIVEGRVSNVQASEGQIMFDYTPGQGMVSATIQQTDPANPIRNITVVRQDRVALHKAGAIFNPDWTTRIRGARLIRFMDWMNTNNSTLSALSDRPKPEDYTWGHKGVPIEVIVALANDLQTDPWITLPHLATDDFARLYYETLRDRLAPGLRAHVEYSNEIWNWQFTQAVWAEDQAKARWGRDYAWVQHAATRAAELADLGAQVFADEPERLVRVISAQTGWKGLEADILTAPLAVAEGATEPVWSFDAWAITGYFAAILGGDEKAELVRGWIADSRDIAEAEGRAKGLAGHALDLHIRRHRFDHAVTLAAEELRDGRHSGNPEDTLQGLLTDLFPYHARIADQYGLKLMMYEGGTHVVPMGVQQGDDDMSDFFIHLNYTPEMGDLYRDLLAGWRAVSDTPFNAFVDVKTPGPFGSWGALRHLHDDNPRWRALAGIE